MCAYVAIENAVMTVCVCLSVWVHRWQLTAQYNEWSAECISLQGLPNGGTVGKYSPNTHYLLHVCTNSTHSYTHIPLIKALSTLHSPSRHSSSPQRGNHLLGCSVYSLPRLLLGPRSLSTSPLQALHSMPTYSLVLGGLEIRLFYPKTEGLWWGWAKGMKPWPE